MPHRYETKTRSPQTLQPRASGAGVASGGAVIAVGNQKGGVGKTTVTVNIAAALGELGHRVLLIDLDPSGGATYHLGVDPYAYEGSVELLAGQADPDDLAIAGDMPENVALIPARPDADGDHSAKTKHLRQALQQVRDAYDFILLDTPPNPKSPNTFAAYAAADWFLFVTSPHALSIRGLGEAIRDVAAIRKGPNLELEVLGVVFNAVDTRTLALRDTKDFLTVHESLRPFGPSGFVPWSVLPNRAAEQGKSLFQVAGYRYQPVTLRFEQIAERIAERCEDRDRFLADANAKPAVERRSA
ncbi:MAG: ParA family protein [Planctomycetota bacterium]